MSLRSSVFFARNLPAAVASCALLLSVTAVSASDERRQLEAHEHGVSSLKIAQEGKQMLFVLDSPGSDVVGFEHAAENDAQKAQIEAALKLLREPAGLFPMPAAAGCTVSGVKASFNVEDDHEDDSKAAKDDHDDDHKDEHGHADEKKEEGHASFNASWTMTCEKPELAATIQTEFFVRFPGAKEIKVEAIGGGGQQSLTLTRSAPNLDLSGVSG